MANVPTPAPANRILTRQQLRSDKGIPLSNPTLLRKEKSGEFPKRFYLSANLAAWLEADIDAWIEARRTAAPVNQYTHNATAARKAKRREQAL